MLKLKNVLCNAMVVMVSGAEGIELLLFARQLQSSLCLQSWEHGQNIALLSVNWDVGILVIPNCHSHLLASIFCTLTKSRWSCGLVPAASSCQWMPLPCEGLCVPCVFPFCLCCRPECTTSGANVEKINLCPKEICTDHLPGRCGTCRALPCTGHVPVGCVGKREWNLICVLNAPPHNLQLLCSSACRLNVFRNWERAQHARKIQLAAK